MLDVPMILEPLIAALPPGSGLALAGSVLIGGAAAALGWWIYAALWSQDLAQGDQWRFDVSRINELRRQDAFFRLFQPAVRILGRINRALFRDSLPEIQREIQVAGLSRYWMAEEYLGKLELLSLLVLPLYVYVFLSWIGMWGLMFAGVAVVVTAWAMRRRLSARARGRLRDIKRRMPFLLDLLTLLMEAGSTFLGALRQAVHEFHGHAVADEFGRVLADMNLGKTRTEAFTAMRERLADDEITAIIGAILQGEQLGTPLARIFRAQADVLRLKRTQRAETVAGEAGVNMLLPAVVVMAATVLVILGPFLLNYLRFGLTL